MGWFMELTQMQNKSAKCQNVIFFHVLVPQAKQFSKVDSPAVTQLSEIDQIKNWNNNEKLLTCLINSLQFIISFFNIILCNHIFPQYRVLKPFIRRDTETKPLKLKLMQEIIQHPKRLDPTFEPPPLAPIDYCYVRPQHIPSVNALCREFFWPGIDCK